MASQVEGRPSVDRRPGRHNQQYANGESNGQYDPDASRPRFVGSAAQEECGPNGSTSSSPLNERSGRNDDSTRNLAIREKSRSRANGSVAGKGSGSLRICTKCGEVLPGQYVRALGGTWHLECFECKVSSPKTSVAIRMMFMEICRSAGRSSLQNSSPPTMARVLVHILSARLTTFDDWICFVTTAVGLLEDLISLL